MSEFAGRQLHVLRLHRAQRLARRHGETGQFQRVQPQAHGVFRAEQIGLAHARHAAQIFQHVGGGETAQVDGIE